MPVIVNPRDYGLWLDPGMQDAKKLAPHRNDAMAAWPVSMLVTNSRADQPRCVEPTR
jgi:putative SOS response-associated peptidase YedK